MRRCERFRACYHIAVVRSSGVFGSNARNGLFSLPRYKERDVGRAAGVAALGSDAEGQCFFVLRTEDSRKGMGVQEDIKGSSRESWFTPRRTFAICFESYQSSPLSDSMYASRSAPTFPVTRATFSKDWNPFTEEGATSLSTVPELVVGEILKQSVVVGCNRPQINQPFPYSFRRFLLPPVSIGVIRGACQE